MELLDIEQELSQKFHTAYLSSMRALVALFDRVLYKQNFIVLPGDEISEKKHKNVKHLMAMERNEDLSRRDTRKFPGLGPSVFKVDFAKVYPDAYGADKDKEGGAGSGQAAGAEAEQNEISGEVEVQNTVHHKAAVRARDEFYRRFRARFLASIDVIMHKFD